MSFPFLQPYAGLSNSLQTAQAGGAGGIGGWVELGRTTAGSEVDKLLITGIANKRYLMVLGDKDPNGSTNAIFRFNEDTGTNYSWRYSGDGASDGTDVSRNLGLIHTTSYTTPFFNVSYISNLSSKEKLYITHGVEQSTAGAGTACTRSEAVGKWANTSDAIDDVEITNTTVGGYKTGSEIVVLGWDPADTHTSNFWEELASVELGSAGDNLSSGTITAKKYLWLQIALKNTGGDINMKLTCNNDTGTNYSRRWTNNGSGNNNSTSESNVQLNSGNNFQFYNIFMINNSANEKLGIVHSVDISSAGAATAPIRSERVFKWANTAAQITEINIDNTAAGSFDTGSIIKVWGAD
jgi:hypothetical protein